jgi:hypothetical protein
MDTLPSNILARRLAPCLTALLALGAAACGASSPEEKDTTANEDLVQRDAPPSLRFQPAATGCAKDISVGPGSDVWILGCDWDDYAAGWDIFTLDASGTVWDRRPGEGVHITVSAQGEPWVSTYFGDVYFGASTGGSRPTYWGFDRVPTGCAVEIAADPFGGAWVIGCQRQGGQGYGIYRYDGSSWSQATGSAVRIAVSPEGTPWVINQSGSVFRWSSITSQFEPVPSPLADEIAVGPADGAWILGRGTGDASGMAIYRYVNGGWFQVDGLATHIAVSPQGTPWVVNGHGQIFSYR